jgi:ElaB/YqjD/DUF883 family membrane-anchored ribosome-binding protein
MSEGEIMTNEELRLQWNNAVALANQASDLLQEAKEADEPDRGYINQCEDQLCTAEENAEEAYKTYIKATSNWVTEAPRRFDAVMVAGTLDLTTHVIPSVTFAFRASSVGEPITVTFANEEIELRRFQKNLGKAIDEAIRNSRSLNHG